MFFVPRLSKMLEHELQLATPCPLSYHLGSRATSPDGNASSLSPATSLSRFSMWYATVIMNSPQHQGIPCIRSTAFHDISCGKVCSQTPSLERALRGATVQAAAFMLRRVRFSPLLNAPRPWHLVRSMLGDLRHSLGHNSLRNSGLLLPSICGVCVTNRSEWNGATRCRRQR